ncbi:MAG TPA: hypothetical protein VNH40_04180 [Gaiellaceae bacterium]|nr:hypothetical protein [Gaiellaceae bacterium]
MEPEGRAGDGIDNWLIGRLRAQPRRPRGEEVVDRLLRPRVVPDVATRLDAIEDAIGELNLRLEALALRQTTRSATTPLRSERADVWARLAPKDRTGRRPGHTFFVPTSKGYDIVEAEGPAPAVGASVTIGDRRYTVEGSRRTPLPLDARPCLVLTHAPADDEGT